MHSIERYGIVALLFLVVTVVAVLMWDGGAKKEKPKEVAAREPAATAPARAERPPERQRRGDPSRRLSLLVEGEDGPPPSTVAEIAEAPAATEPSLEEQPEVAPPATLSAEEDEPESPPTTPPAGKTAGKGTTAPVANPASFPSYSVRPGDTLSEIAQRTLGSSRRWPEIVAVNPGLDPSRLRSGTSIRLPAGSAVGAKAGESAAPAAKPTTASATAAPARTWKVGAGESLWRIAERALGDGNRWKEIAALNPGVSADRLVLGAVLKLPAAPGGAKPTTPPAGKKEKAPLLASAPAPAKAARGGKVK